MFSFIILQTGGGMGIGNLIPLALIFIVFYFFLIRPQVKKQKQQTKFSEALEKGDEVVTSSGILGRINKIEGDIITLEVANKTYIRVTRSAVSKELTETVYAKATNEKAK